ncbi:hypothetical protein RHSIM_Rhsim10G0199300 [Rhododendron simsii]|uniref:Uncharacterized protein n=1 Tax=Rhododendron simsii TaxID=118357 RepID=A0A834LCT9_RHOSS|nr:hypothetical protein RHSIM_Rhsim10G0199300 [Rhododendron simsii]
MGDRPSPISHQGPLVTGILCSRSTMLYYITFFLGFAYLSLALGVTSPQEAMKWLMVEQERTEKSGGGGKRVLSEMASSSAANQSPRPNIEVAPNYIPYPTALAKYEDVVITPKLFMDTLEKLHATMGTKFIYLLNDLCILTVGTTSLMSSESSRIPFLSGENFSEWKDKVLLALGCMDLDLAIREDEPPKPTNESSIAVRVAYDRWERSNRLSLMLIKTHISSSIRNSIPSCDKVKDYMKAIEEQFVSSDKALANTLMNRLSGMKHNSSRSVREHIMGMRDIVARLKSLEIEISDSFLVHFILNSLPAEFGPFKISYNTHKEKWSINELLTMCVQEEERIVEARNAKFIEDIDISGSKSQRIEWEQSLDSITAPENEEKLVVIQENQQDILHEHENGEAPTDQQRPVNTDSSTQNPPNVNEVVEIRKSSRIKKPAISSDYLVYLMESDYDIGPKDDPISFTDALFNRLFKSTTNLCGATNTILQWDGSESMEVANLVTPNLYGNLVANTAAGIAGGTGVMPGGNVEDDHAVFEQGASAGNVGNMKVLEQKKENPV